MTMENVQVLLIDDNDSARQGLELYLTKVANFDVSSFADGEKALEHLASVDRHFYTTVLLDYSLTPQMTGEQVLKDIQKKFPKLPVIVFTGKDRTGGVKSLEKGAYYFMSRPLNRIELINIIHNLKSQNALFKDIARDARLLLNADICIAWQFDKRGKRFVVGSWDEVAGKDLSPEFRNAVHLDLDNKATQDFLAKRRPLFLSDVRDPDCAPEYLHREEAKKYGWASLLSTPLIWQEKIIGILDCYFYSPYTFPEVSKDRLKSVILPAFANQAAEAIKNAQLSNQLQAIQGISHLLAGTFDEETIINQILEKGLELVEADFGWLYLIDTDTSKLKLVASHGIDEALLDQERDIGQGITGIVAAEGRAQNISNVAEHNDFIKIEGYDIKSELVIPLRREERTVGVLTAKSSSLGAFSDDDEDLLITLALQAAIAIERSSLTKHLEKLSQLALSGKFDSLADYAVAAVSEMTGAEAILWLMSEKEEERGNTFRILASKGNFDVEHLETAVTPITPGSSLTSIAVQEKKPIFRSDIQDGKDKIKFHHMEVAKRRGFHSFMAVPLIGSNEQILGSFNLYSGELDKFGKPEVDLMQTFANQVATALEEVQRKKKIEGLAEIGRLALQDFGGDALALLQNVVDKGREMTGANYVVLFPYHQRIPNYYDTDNIVVSGLKKFSFREKPKELGLSAMIRKIGELVVYDVEKWRLSKDSVQQLESVGFDLAKVIGRIQRVNFIKEKKIKSFIGISIKAQESDITSPNLDESIGVLYFDFTHDHQITADGLEWVRIFSQQVGSVIYNSRLLDNLRHRAKGHKALNVIGDRLSGLLDEETILKEVAQSAAQALDCIHCSVFRLQKDQLIVAAVDGEYAQTLHLGRTFELGQGIAGWVAQHEESALVLDTSDDKRYEAGWHKAEDIQRQDVKDEPGSLIVVPIFVNKVIYGVISIEQNQTAGFTQLDQEFLEILARQASSAIENAQLVRRLLTLNDASRELSSKLEIQNILNEAIEATFKTVNCNHCTFFVLENDLLIPKASKSMQEQPSVVRTFSLGKGLVGKVAQSGQSMLTVDARREEGFVIGKNAPDVDRSMILIPVKTSNGIFGVISVDQDRINAFSEQDLQLVEILALQVGIAIENAKLIEQMRLLQNISASISAAQKLEDTLKLIVEGGMQLTGTEAGVIHLISNEQLEISNSYAYPEGGVHISSRFSQKVGFTWELYNTGEMIVVSDLAENKWVNKKGIDLGIRALIGVPLKVENKTMGALFLNDTHVREFSAQEKELLLTLANSAAIAVEKTRLLGELETKNEQLEIANRKLDDLINRKIKNLNTVIEMGSSLTASVDLSETEVLQLIYQQLDPLMNTENMYIALYDHATDMVSFPLMYVDGKEKKVASRKAGLGRTEYILNTKEPIFIETRKESQAWYKKSGRQEYIGDPLASWIGVPMISGSKAIGVIATYHKTEDHVYDQDDLEILQAIANQAAIALEVTQRIAELNALQSLTDDLSAGLL